MSQFDCYQLQLVYPTVAYHPVKISTMKLQKPLLTRSINHNTFSIHCTNIFLHFGCVFTFPAIIKHNGWKCCFFSPSILSIKMATQKLTNLLSCFFLCTLIWQLSQYNPTVVLNEVRQLSATRVILQKNWTKVLANPREWSISGFLGGFVPTVCFSTLNGVNVYNIGTVLSASCNTASILHLIT